MNSVKYIQAVNWLEEMKIKNYTINDDGVIDVDGDVVINDKLLNKIPVQFGVVSGDFICSFNKLTSLKGSPKIVYGCFDCCVNPLTSLEHIPQYVEGHIWCYHVNLNSSYIKSYISSNCKPDRGISEDSNCGLFCSMQSFDSYPQKN